MPGLHPGRPRARGEAGAGPQALRVSAALGTGIIALPTSVWASHLLNRTVCGMVRRPCRACQRSFHCWFFPPQATPLIPAARRS